MMRIKVFVLLLLSILPVMAQKQFTLDQLLSGGKEFRAMQPKLDDAVWWGDVLVERQKDNCVAKDFKKDNQKTTLFTLSDVNTALQAAGLKTCKQLNNVSFPYSDQPLTLLQESNEYQALYDWKEKRIVWKQSWPKEVSLKDWNAPSRHLAYVSDHNLFILTAEGETLQVSNDGSRNLTYGESVHRNEFGINSGIFWSPQGELLCFYRMDQSMVADYPLVSIENPIAQLAPEKYPMAGQTSHKVSIGIYNLQNKQTIWLKTGDNTDQYYSGITWSPDSKKIYLYHNNRAQNDLRLEAYDVSTGNKLEQIFEEKRDKYIDPQYGLWFLPWDSNKFLYCLEDRLFLYDLKSRQTRSVGEQAGIIVDLLGFNTKKKSFIVCGTGASPVQHNLFSISLAGKETLLLDNGVGVHRGRLSESGNYIIDRWTSPAVRSSLEIVSSDSKKVWHLQTAKDPWADFAVPEISLGKLKAADGTTDLYYRLIKPTNFDANKKYPAIVYVYGGPHTRLVDNSFGQGYRGWEIYMAQKGYVVFVLDNRGSSERGIDFENVTWHHLGNVEVEDQMKGVDFLKSLPYVDGNRLGVHGWSYGGFMTINLMLSHPDVFKVGVAGGPVIDWRYYEVMYGERYMGTPQNNPEGYKESDLKEKAKNLKGRLLVIFGYNDPVCVPQHTLSFIRACEDAQTHPDLFTYPGQEHNMVGADRIHLHEHITQYFEDFLK